jgi:hypothetical protein
MAQGMGFDELVKSRQSEHFGHELPNPKTPQNAVQTPSVQLDRVTEVSRSSTEMGAGNRRSVDSDQFVDALTSPLQKPKDWSERYGEE